MVNWPDPDLPPINLWNAPRTGERIPSPCVRQCSLEEDVCTGCGRTLEEITQWRHMSPNEQLIVLRRLAHQH